jgi:hypothetical protein
MRHFTCLNRAAYEILGQLHSKVWALPGAPIVVCVGPRLLRVRLTGRALSLRERAPEGRFSLR